MTTGRESSPNLGRGADHAAACLLNDFPDAADMSFNGPQNLVRIERSMVRIGPALVGVTRSTGHHYRMRESDTLGFLCPDYGSISAEVGGKLFEASANSGALLAYGPGHARNFSAGSAGTFLVVSRPILMDYACGLDGQETLLDGPREVSVASNAVKALKRNIAAIYHEMARLSQDGLSGLGNRLNTEFLHYLLLLVMMPARFGQVMRVDVAQSKTVAAKSREFMIENACDDISLFGLAENLGVTLRTLQISFRRETGQTPSQFLIEQRLLRARDLLLGAEPGITATSAANACRFFNQGAFAQRYRLRFGELPSETLRQSASARADAAGPSGTKGG